MNHLHELHIKRNQPIITSVWSEVILCFNAQYKVDIQLNDCLVILIFNGFEIWSLKRK